MFCNSCLKFLSDEEMEMSKCSCGEEKDFSTTSAAEEDVIFIKKEDASKILSSKEFYLYNQRAQFNMGTFGPNKLIAFNWKSKEFV